MLFGREVAIEFGIAGLSGVRFTDLRVSFRTESARSGRPGTARIDVWNLAQGSIALLQTKGAVVRLIVGYDAPRTIFEGNPVRNGITVTKQGTDRITTIEAHDGGNTYQDARVRLTLATDATLQAVVAAVAAGLGIPTGRVVVATGGGVPHFPHGVSFHGPARDALDHLAGMAGADWWIHGGVLYFLRPDQDTGELAVSFSAANGNLVGSPSPKDDGIVEVTALLDPGIRPGRPFVVQAERYSGAYAARDVTFVGDSGFDRPYYVIVTGKPRVPVAV